MAMRILVVGGTGLIGGHAALRLHARGHDVTIAGRRPPAPDTPLAALGFMPLDFTAEVRPELLAGFEVLIFAAVNDARHVPKGADLEAHVARVNAVAAPRFVAAARAAGVRRAIHVGSFYHQVMPELIATNAYIRSRRDCDDAIRALATPSFAAISINPPFVCGAVPGLVTPYRAYTRYAQANPAPTAPPGGVNVMSTDSLSDAIEDAIAGGESGRAYLVGDDNLSFQELFGAFLEAVGRPPPAVVDEEHKLLPDSFIPWGRGRSLHYQVDAAGLVYRRNDVRRTIRDLIVPQFRSNA